MKRTLLIAALFVLPAFTALADRSTVSAVEDAVDRHHSYASRQFLRSVEWVNTLLSNIFRDADGRESELIHAYYGDLVSAYEVEGSHLRITPALTFEEGGETGLAYFFTDRVDRSLSLSGGIRFRPKPSPQLRVRARFTKPFDIWTAEYSQGVFWDLDNGFGERSQLRFSRLVMDDHVFRLTTFAVWSKLSQGVDWSQGAVYHVPISRRKSVAFRGAVRGHTHPNRVVDQYAFRTAYRQRIHRDWLFMEVEPGPDFTREEDFDPSPLIAFKIEIVIGSYDAIP